MARCACSMMPKSTVRSHAGLHGYERLFRFENNALINLSAPITGDTAGILIWELQGPSFAAAAAAMPRMGASSVSAPAKVTNQHRIASDRAKVLTVRSISSAAC